MSIAVLKALGLYAVLVLAGYVGILAYVSGLPNLFPFTVINEMPADTMPAWYLPLGRVLYGATVSLCVIAISMYAYEIAGKLYAMLRDRMRDHVEVVPRLRGELRDTQRKYDL